MIASRVPAKYGEVLQLLTETNASGRGGRPSSNIEKVTGTPPTNFAGSPNGRWRLGTKA
ncbi:MAG: hypothetical protein ACLQVK_08030 [Acidimicrobiales bacterium]